MRLKDAVWSRLPDRWPRKVFCIGANKTGTTSLKQALEELGYRIGNQAEAEIVGLYALQGDVQRLLNYCKCAEAFQDVPFSKGDIYKTLKAHFPDAGFILSVRDDENEWYESLVRFHTRRLSQDGLPPRIRDLKRSKYRYRGYEFESAQLRLEGQNCADDDFAFEENACKNGYLERNREITAFFGDAPNFIVLNLKDEGAYGKLCDFLGKKPVRRRFPHLNSSRAAGP